MVLSVFGGANVVAAHLSSRVSPDVQTAATPWTYPTTTMEEPNYTGGTYVAASYVDVIGLNIWTVDDLYSFILLNELYDSPYQYAPNETYIPWAATSYSETSANFNTFDPINGTTQHVSYIYNVTLRPGIQWTDWTPATASNTYTFSNYTSFTAYNTTTGLEQAYTYQYPWPSVKMNTETIQSADLIMSWKVLVSGVDTSADWSNIVNIVPTSNLTAEYYLSAQSATFPTYTLTAPILPYHLWVQHDWSSTHPGVWNYTGAANGYDVWDFGYNSATGMAPDLIGSGPFMFSNNYGQPQGAWVPGDYYDLYVNPHYFVQYVPSLRQWTPKIDELYSPLYLSESDAVTALVLGQADTVLSGVDPTFIPTISADPNAYIFFEPPSGYGYAGFNTWGNTTPMTWAYGTFGPAVADPPFNITAVRQAINYATNKAYLCSVVDEGYCSLGQPIVPPSDAAWYNATAPMYDYNPTLAESLLAGVPGMVKSPSTGNWYYEGKPVTMNILTTVQSADPLGVEEDLIMAQEWDAIGIPTTVLQAAFSTLIGDLFTIDYTGVVTLGITGIEGDPTGDFESFYDEQQTLGTGFYYGPFSAMKVNGVNMTGPQIDNLMDTLYAQLNSVTNFTQRLSIADEIEGIAAQESTIININYGIGIIPFNNATFTGIVPDALSYSSFIYWAFNTVALKPTAVTVPSGIKSQLEVGVVAPTTVYMNGQYGNLSIEVRNQFGQPEPGMTVSIGSSPSGMLLNISSDTGVTNATGGYQWEFQVLPTNVQVYTADYFGQVNFTVSAVPPSTLASTVVPGVGHALIDVAPAPVAYYAPNATSLLNGGAPEPFNILVYNPVTGAPISGYKYQIEALQGAVNLTAASPSTQIVEQTTSFNYVYYFGFASVLDGSYTNYNITSISGTTGANGLITVDVQANSSANFTVQGNEIASWLFVGNYVAGSAIAGEGPYQSVAELSSSFDPGGFGIQEPVELPLTVVNGTGNVTLSISVSSDSIGPSGTATVTVTATNASGPVPDYAVTLYDQNALGANRGLLTNTSGIEVAVPSPNQYFETPYYPGIQLTTNSDGVATAVFSPGLYQPVVVSGVVSGFSPEPYTDPWLIPFDEFQFGAYGANSTFVGRQIASTELATPVTPSVTAAAYIAGTSRIDGIISLTGGASYTLYVNTTLNSPAGPSAGNIPVSVATSLGSVSPASGTTSSAGTFTATFAAPSVGTPTAVFITVTYTASSGHTVNLTQVVYVMPSFVKVSSTNLDIYYALIGLFAVLMVIFLALWASARGRRPPPSTMPAEPSGGSGGMSGPTPPMTGSGPGTPPGGT